MAERCPEPNPECKFYGTEQCIITTHHLYWPKKRYHSGVEKDFRELPENKVRLPRCDHNEVHATERPPQKPPREEMLQALAATALQEAS